MAKDGKLVLRLTDVYGRLLKEKVDIMLRHQVLSETSVVKGVLASKAIRISNLHAAPQGLYRIEIDPPSYLPVSRFVNIKSSGDTNLEVQFPIDPKKVVRVQFPPYQELSEDLRTLLENSDRVLSFEGKKGAELYDALDDIRKSGLLNIAAKAQATPLSNGRNVLSYVQKLNELRGDRFYAVVPKELREETKNSVAEDLFHSVSGALHRRPDGYSEAGSFKTNDPFGNLQLTFFMNGDDCVADIDIDDAGGLGHVFQVLRNSLTGRPTHPYDIHEILVYHQQLDPGYSFAV